MRKQTYLDGDKKKIDLTNIVQALGILIVITIVGVLCV